MDTDAPFRPNRPPAGAALRWHFAGIVIDERSGEVRVRGKPAHLHNKPKSVLLHLLRHAGEVVTKDELADACWPRRFLSDSVVTTTINRLRAAIGDSGQTVICTVHGFGYRLATEVRVEQLPSAPVPWLAFQVGDHPPLRPTWSLLERLSSGSSGEVWRVQQDKTGELRVFKFAVDNTALTAIKREITLFRLLRQALGERPDIVTLLDWNLEAAPFFIELEDMPAGSLQAWTDARGGLTTLPLPLRLELIAQCAETLAAAHAVGVLHGDLKPSNLLVHDPPGSPVRVKLGDFGSGRVLDTPCLGDLQITRRDVSAPMVGGGETGGTPLYLAPEILRGQPVTVQADVYALGVMLYQAVTGSWDHPLVLGWEDDVADELLREDIAVAVNGEPARRLADAAMLARSLRSLDVRRLRRDDARRMELQQRALSEKLSRSRLRRRWLSGLVVVLLGGFGSTGALYLGLRSAHHQRQLALEQAHREAAGARAVTDYVVSLFEAANPKRTGGKPIDPRRLVEEGRRRIETRFSGQPLLQAQMLATIGTLNCKLGQTASCRQDLEEALSLAQAQGDGEPLLLAILRFRLASALRAEGRPQEALVLLQLALP